MGALVITHKNQYPQSRVANRDKNWWIAGIICDKKDQSN
jgi:hypothetical protein